jgi:hypothetical protein
MVGNNLPKLIVMKSRLYIPLFEKDDCMDAGGRVTQEAVTEGPGEIYQTNPPRSPFEKGGSYF